MAGTDITSLFLSLSTATPHSHAQPARLRFNSRHSIDEDEHCNVVLTCTPNTSRVMHASGGKPLEQQDQVVIFPSIKCHRSLPRSTQLLFPGCDLFPIAEHLQLRKHSPAPVPPPPVSYFNSSLSPQHSSTRVTEMHKCAQAKLLTNIVGRQDQSLSQKLSNSQLCFLGRHGRVQCFHLQQHRFTCGRGINRSEVGKITAQTRKLVTRTRHCNSHSSQKMQP